jgi:hypothetical protein
MLQNLVIKKEKTSEELGLDHAMVDNFDWRETAYKPVFTRHVNCQFPTCRILNAEGNKPVLCTAYVDKKCWCTQLLEKTCQELPTVGQGCEKVL